MAGAQRSTEHDESDRTAFAVMLVVIGLVGSLIALAHRQGIEHASAPGDACPTEAHGGIVGLDARTGEVRWSNIVPDGGGLRLDEATGELHHIRAANTDDGPDGSIVVDRVIAPDTGRVVSCSSQRSDQQVTEHNQWIYGGDPVDPPISVDGLTIMRWGSGLRATDAENTGVWGLDSARATYRLGDDLIVRVAGEEGEPERTERIDAATGKPRWSVEGILTNRGPGIDTPTTNSWQHMDRLTGLDPASGEERWTTNVPGWSDDLSDGVVSTFDVGSLVIVPNGNDGRVAAIDARTGEVRWTARAGAPGTNDRYSEPGEVHAAALSADGRTVVVAIDSWLGDQYD